MAPHRVVPPARAAALRADPDVVGRTGGPAVGAVGDLQRRVPGPPSSSRPLQGNARSRRQMRGRPAAAACQTRPAMRPPLAKRAARAAPRVPRPPAGAVRGGRLALGDDAAAADARRASASWRSRPRRTSSRRWSNAVRALRSRRERPPSEVREQALETMTDASALGGLRARRGGGARADGAPRPADARRRDPLLLRGLRRRARASPAGATSRRRTRGRRRGSSGRSPRRTSSTSFATAATWRSR